MSQESPSENLEKKKQKMREYYHRVVKPKRGEGNIYYPEKLKTPRKPL